MIVTSLVVVNTILLAVMIVFLLKFKRSIPDIQQVLNDVGGSMSEQLANIFKDGVQSPVVSKAMGILGKASGEVRADKATKKKVIDAVMEQQPGLSVILERIGISPEEGFSLLRDPTFGPIIQGFLSKGLSGIGKLTQGFDGGGGSGSGSGSIGYA